MVTLVIEKTIIFSWKQLPLKINVQSESQAYAYCFIDTLGKL